MGKEQKSDTGTGNKGYSFSPGTGRPKAPPPNKAAADVSAEGDLDSLDDINVESVIADGSSDTSDKREERIVCSFPGIMKVLVPEKSFVPIAVAVRVANLSSGGAMVEIHDRAREDRTLNLPDRFFELKIAHPEIPLLRGTIAWTDCSGEKPLLGLSFFERHEALATHDIVSDTHRKVAGPPPLPELTVDPFPPSTNEETLVITGKAMESNEIIVRGEDGTTNVPVVKNRFEITLKLSPDKKNHFKLQGVAGMRSTRQVPIQVLFERDNNRGKFIHSISSSEDRFGNHRVRLTFSGTMRQAERMLYRFSEIQANGDRLDFDATVTGATRVEQRLIDALHSEGAVLSADTTRNEVAAKLLDELLF
ncbi:MAG: hypothetical protein JJU11_08955 [Candidatus Sumerlaeia bacterium]|nr:hypothetical protein [Candidatus Sumerlaeia bacterium]